MKIAMRKTRIMNDNFSVIAFEVLCFILFHMMVTDAKAQSQDKFSKFDPRHWGVVLQHSGQEKVTVKKDVTYHTNAGNPLHIDIYSMPEIKKIEKRPAIIFLNGIGERPGEDRVKSWAIYSTWPQLMAAYGYIGISMETDGDNVTASFEALFKFLKENGVNYNIDADRIGVYAASANTTESGKYLMNPNCYPGIKATVLYYGNMPQGPLRKDLPIFFMISEGDIRGNGYRNIWEDIWRSRAPWTVRMGTNLPHGFDAFTDNDEARKLVKETIAFWQSNLDPVPQPNWEKSVEREIVEAGYWHNYPKLLKMIEDWMKKNPGSKDPAVKDIYADALFNTGHYAEAEPMLKELAAKDTSNKFVLSQLAIIAYKLNRATEAEQYFANFIRDFQPKRNFIWGFAGRLYEAKLYNEAGLYYEKANAIESRSGDLYNQGCCFALANNIDKAFESLNKAADAGFTDKRQYENDADLSDLKKDHRWKVLLDKLR